MPCTWPPRPRCMPGSPGPSSFPPGVSGWGRGRGGGGGSPGFPPWGGRGPAPKGRAPPRGPTDPSTGCYVDVKRKTHETSFLFFSSYGSFGSRPKRDLLLYVARHLAVTLARDGPLSQAKRCPGLSVSWGEPQGAAAPGSASRRVVPWGTVSSWVTGADGTGSRRTNGRCCLKTTAIRTVSF